MACASVKAARENLMGRDPGLSAARAISAVSRAIITRGIGTRASSVEGTDRTDTVLPLCTPGASPSSDVLNEESSADGRMEQPRSFPGAGTRRRAPGCSRSATYTENPGHSMVVRVLLL